MKRAILTAACLAWITAACHALPPARPNVVLFLVDDMGWMDSEPYGSTYYRTPRMSRLASQSMRFTDAYASPLCSPTRASILSGQYSARHGILTASGHQPPQPPGFEFMPDSAPPNRAVISPMSKNYLEPSQITLAEALKAAGYRTGHFGKWHLGLTAPHWPDRQGFDVAFHGKPDPGPASYFSPYSFKQFQSFADGPKGEYITDRLTDEAIRFIESSKGGPFFLNLWHYGLHGPWGHKAEYTQAHAGRTDPRGLQGNPIMASMLQSIDESLGRILDALDRLDLARDTVFIFFSDNGGNTHSNTPDDRKRNNPKKGNPKNELMEDWRRWAGDRPPTNNAPLRKGKGTLYEGGTRVPLMIRWPGRVPEGAASAQVVGAIDLYPTVLELLGVERPAGQKIDGVSLAGTLLRNQPVERAAYFNYFPMGGPSKPGGVWVRRGPWKLIRWFETGPDQPEPLELYNLADDLGESKNLAGSMPERVREMNALIEGFFKDTDALVPRPNPAYRPAASPSPANAADPLRGWVPKFSRVEPVAGALRVTADGRAPFLGTVQIKHAGPATMELQLRAPAGGEGKIQWRTEDQATFLDEQIVRFTLQASPDPQGVGVHIPVRGKLIHLRLYLPADRGAVDLIQARYLDDASQKAVREWSFP